MKKTCTSLVALLLSLVLAAPAFADSAHKEPLDKSIEKVVEGLIPDGFTTNAPVVTKVGASQRKSYFIFKKPGPDGRGYYDPPLIVVETLDGKVISQEKLGSEWGWTTIRPARSIGLGDPRHDLELREYTNGLESRLIGFSDGFRMQIVREGKPAEPFFVKPAESYEVQLGSVNVDRVLVETLAGKTSVYSLKGATFSVNPTLTAAAVKGIGGVKTFAEDWSSRTSGLLPARPVAPPVATPPATPPAAAPKAPAVTPAHSK